MIVLGADVADALQCLGAVSVASLPGVKFAILTRLARAVLRGQKILDSVGQTPEGMRTRGGCAGLTGRTA